jgi:CubicO group peptidase (beta-lactamase class C family)
MKFILIAVLVTLSAESQNLKIFADSLLLKYNIPELGFAVIKADSVLEIQNLGFHRVDLKNENTKAKLNDYYHLGSNTKAITGFVAAYLVENNKIKWNTKFFDLFPDLKKKANPEYYNITLEDLLSHRAKIQPYTSGLEYSELPYFIGTKSEQRKQFARYLLKQKSVKSNKTYNYSNAGYSIASLMLEKVSKKDWEELTKEIFNKKLKLNIAFSWPNKIDKNQPFGHWIENDTLVAVSPNTDYNLQLGEPAGDISMTLPDYSKFIQYNLKGLLGDNNILKSETYEYLNFGLKEYSIGWRNRNTQSEKFSEHSGSAGTFFCYTLIDFFKISSACLNIPLSLNKFKF